MEEPRTIRFSAEELERAIAAHQRRVSPDFRDGSIKALRVADDPPSVTVSIANVRGDHRAVVIAEQQLLAAMVEFCLSCKVPLPLRSAKRIEVIGGRIALVIEISGAALAPERTEDAHPPWLPRLGPGLGRVGL